MNVPYLVGSKSITCVALLFFVLPAVFAQSAQTQSSNNSSSEVKQLQEQLEQMQAEMKQLRDQVRTLQQARQPSLRNATYEVPSPSESMPSEAAAGDAGVTTRTVATTATPAPSPQAGSTAAQSERSLDVYG